MLKVLPLEVNFSFKLRVWAATDPYLTSVRGIDRSTNTNKTVNGRPVNSNHTSTHNKREPYPIKLCPESKLNPVKEATWNIYSGKQWIKVRRREHELLRRWPRNQLNACSIRATKSDQWNVNKVPILRLSPNSRSLLRRSLSEGSRRPGAKPIQQDKGTLTRAGAALHLSAPKLEQRFQSHLGR